MCCRFTIRKAIAVYRSRLRCSGVANATPKRLFGADCARAEGQLQRYNLQYQRRSNAPLPPYSSCSLHMLVILPTGTNRMNSCRWTANHEHLTSALRCKRYAEQSPAPKTLPHSTASKQLACSTSQGEGGSCPWSDWSDTHRHNKLPQVRCSQQTPRKARY